MKLLLLSEGGRDIGTHDEARSGAVRVLARRVLEEHLTQRPPLKADEIQVDRLPRLNKLDGPRNHEKRVVTAWNLAQSRGCRSLVIVVDRDREASRTTDWTAARDAHASSQSIAVGVAVETVEAWLIADERGVNAGLGHAHPRCAEPASFDGAPGTPKHPKTEFLRRASNPPNGATDAYGTVAAFASLTEIERRCPSFESFANELRRRAK